jgi:electron transport complex protein RnfG
MKKTIANTMSCLTMMALSATFLSATPQNDEVMTKENGMYVINTTTLGKNVTGYVSTTPLKIYIKKNKVEKIEALKNEETPKYFAKVKKGLLDKWNGLKVNEAQKKEVDGVTGATFSSDAVKENVKLGLEYYKSHK